MTTLEGHCKEGRKHYHPDSGFPFFCPESKHEQYTISQSKSFDAHQVKNAENLKNIPRIETKSSLTKRCKRQELIAWLTNTETYRIVLISHQPNMSSLAPSLEELMKSRPPINTSFLYASLMRKCNYLLPEKPEQYFPNLSLLCE